MKLNFEGIIRSLNAKAHTISYDNERLKNLIKESKKRLEGNKAFAELIEDVKVTIELIKYYINGEYTALSKRSLIVIIIGFLYLVNPLDIIPDFLISGFIDDAAVFAYLIKKIHHEIDVFKQWKLKQVNDKDYIDMDEGNPDL
jgi:uncharacterized membrane protein YkvA (DUF1232 family)